MLQSMLSRGILARNDEALSLTEPSRRFTADFGIDTGAFESPARALCIGCLDWSERRDHLAGKLGAAYLSRLIELKWARRDASSRAVLFSRRGLAGFNEMFPI